MLLIITLWNAEGNQTAAKPASEKGDDEANDPGKLPFSLSDMRHTLLSAELAGILHLAVWPAIHRVLSLHHGDGRLLLHHHHLLGLLLNDNIGLAGLSLHHQYLLLRLLYYHWLLLNKNGLLLGQGALRLLISWLRLLLVHQRLLIRCHLSNDTVIDLVSLLVH